MPGVRARGALVGLLVVLGLAVGGAVGAQAWARSRVDGALGDRGLTWAGTSHGFRHLAYEEVEGDGVRVQRIEVDLLAREAWVRGARVQLGGSDGGGDGEADLVERVLDGLTGLPEASSRLGARLADFRGRAEAAGLEVLVLDDVEVSLGDRALLTGLGGTVLPDLALGGDQGSLKDVHGVLAAELRVDLDSGPVRGAVVVELDGDDVHIESEGLSLSHPRLATRPVGPVPLALEVSADRPGEVRWSLGPEVQGTLRAGGEQVQVVMAPAPLDALVGVFGDAVPEASRARMGGRLAFEGALEGPPWSLRGRLEVVDPLVVTGVISDTGALRRGQLTWRVPDGSGGFTVRETSPRDRHWVSPRSAPLLVEAVLASEDAGFRSHAGFDPVAISEALDRMAEERAAGQRPQLRGASTLTQQLAKNLFLDPEERTLVRKVRELLYAVELEELLGKEGVLALYLNIVEMGPELHGMGAAADAFFLKRGSGLSVREAAYLAWVLPAPKKRYHQHYLADRPPRAPLDAIIENMVDTGALSRGQAEQAKAAELRFVPPAE